MAGHEQTSSTKSNKAAEDHDAIKRLHAELERLPSAYSRAQRAKKGRHEHHTTGQELLRMKLAAAERELAKMEVVT